MKTWIAIILLSSFGLLAFAGIATEGGAEGYQARLPDEILNRDRAALESRAAACAAEKRDALRVNDHARYRQLVGDLECHYAELVVYGERG